MTKFITILSLCLAVSSGVAYSQTFAEVEELFKKQREALGDDAVEIDDSMKDMMVDYDNYRKEMLSEHEKFSKEIQQKWGEDNVAESTNKSWVEYGDDKDSRSIVDFEKGEVSIEVLLSPEDLKSDPDLLKKKMQGALADAMNSKGSTQESGGAPISVSAILNKQLDLGSLGVDLSLLFQSVPAGPPPAPTVGANATLPGREKRAVVPGAAPQVLIHDAPKEVLSIIEPDGALDYAEAEEIEIVEIAEVVVEKLVQENEIKIEEVVSESGEKKIVAKMELNLVTDHLSKRAAEYSALVTKYSMTYDIDEPVIYAIMEQESAFNPAARSWVPAYGLMQLVPTSGGLDAYTYVYKEKKVVSGEYLFVPQNNIELGTAYLKILKSRNFQSVKDPRCQLLCMVAAYNCGAGNVSRAMTGNTNLTKAIPLINELSYDDLYSHFRQKLPDETKDYVYKITRNIEKYSGK